jgi:hypothetical protein
MRYAILIAGLISCTLLEPSRALAQQAQRPAGHWGTFTKNASLNDCLAFARDALRSKGYKLDETHGFIRIGETDKVIVQVVCIPLGAQKTSVTVSAYSTDSKTAELARNTIREYIVKVVRID